jgi:hypothetical protein
MVGEGYMSNQGFRPDRDSRTDSTEYVVLICAAFKSNLQYVRSHACDERYCTATAGPPCRMNAGTGRCDFKVVYGGWSIVSVC